jgi:DNA-binding FadR family transcriptional regulator
MPRMTVVSPLDIMNARMIIEPQAAAAAASTASEADIASIADAQNEAARSLDMEIFERWDAEFHKRIFTSTRNEFLTNLHDILRPSETAALGWRSNGAHFRKRAASPIAKITISY